MLTRQDDIERKNWATSLKNEFYTYGFGIVENWDINHLFINLNKE
jgi:hypothetical protein